MVNITKCVNNSCPIKETCYRHTATPNPLWQSYSFFGNNKDFAAGNYDCDHYYPCERIDCTEGESNG